MDSEIEQILAQGYWLVEIWSVGDLQTNDGMRVLMGLFELLKRHDPDRYWEAFNKGVGTGGSSRE